MPMHHGAAARAAGAVLTLCLAACGGSSDSGGADGLSVRLLANTSVTPWRTGSLGFTVSPALGTGDTVACRIDGGPEAACATGAATGRMPYSGLASGDHTLTVTVNRAGQSSSRELRWRIADPEVVVYGSTPAGISAALAAARGGRVVALIEPTTHLGGMLTGGLAKTDVGRSSSPPIGGIAAEFFDRVRVILRQKGACPNDEVCPGAYDLEPHVADQVFAEMLAEQSSLWVQRALAVTEVERGEGGLAAMVTPRGRLPARVFIDATYEGDLMALAGIGHTLRREARRSVADGVDPGEVEDNAGFRVLARPYALNIDPYVVPGQPASGLLPFVEAPASPMPAAGDADDRLMAYNYRVCVTDDPANRVPFARPADYDPARYEGSSRVAVAMAASGRMPLDRLYFNPYPTVGSRTPGYQKYDLNGGSVFSIDMSAPGWNQAWATADGAGRQAIAAAYRSYIEGLLYHWRTDPRFGALNAKVGRFGLCADEFTDNGHFPTQLYVRESRRMLGEYVMNENDVMGNGRRPAVADSIAMGSYDLDAHLRRITTARIGGRDVVVSEGFMIQRQAGDPRYRIPYRSLLPRRAEADNLLNPVTLSATSMAISSIRMEPTFMSLGQAAGTAAALAVERSQAVHDVDIGVLQSRLQRDGQVLR